MTMGFGRRELLAGGLGLGVAACSRHGDSGLPGNTVKIATIGLFSHNQVRLRDADYAIEKEGWLREQLARRGIGFAWFQAPNAAVGPIVNEAFASRQIQFAGYSDLPAIILNASPTKEKTRLVAAWPPGDSYLVVPANSTAKSIEDLKGKRLAIHRGRPWELPLLRLLETHGLSYKDFQLYNINPEAGAAAVATGGVDALFTIQPFQLEDKGIAKSIWSTVDLPLDWKGWGGLWAAHDILERQPEITQLVVTAFVKGSHWASLPEHKDEILREAALIGTPLKYVRRTYEESGLSYKDHFSPVLRPEIYDHYRQAISFARKNGIINADVDVDKLIDDRWVKTALKELDLTDYWTSPKTPVEAR